MRKGIKNFIRLIIKKLKLSYKNPNEDEDDNSEDGLNPHDNVDELELSNSENKEESKCKVIL